VGDDHTDPRVDESLDALPAPAGGWRKIKQDG
jgi:hypothetical protein